MLEPMAGGSSDKPKIEIPTKPVEITDKHELHAADLSTLRGLKNTLKKKHLFESSSKDSWDDMHLFEEPRGKMFTAESDGSMTGFIGIAIDREKNTAEIKSLRTMNRDLHIMRALMEKALIYLRDKGVGSVSVGFSFDNEADLDDSKHVLKEFDFEEAEADGKRVFKIDHL